MSIADKVDAAIRDVCPINGVSIGRPEDKATWRIDFSESATDAQRTAAQAVVDAFSVAPDSPNDAINAQIKAMEDDQNLARGVREYIMAGMVEKAATLGLTEQQLYDRQVGYRRLKDFDDQIKALRAQRKP